MACPQLAAQLGCFRVARHSGVIRRIGRVLARIARKRCVAHSPRETLLGSCGTSRVHGDQMTFNGSSQFFDTNGNVLAVACASGTGTRFEDVGGEG